MSETNYNSKLRIKGEMGPESFQTFEDLDAYKAAREFRKAMYHVSRQLPDYEKFALATQIRRASVSLTNNIAEGHGRFHYLDQIKFMLQARGSLQELVDDLNVTDEERYLSPEDVSKLKEQGWGALRILNGYLRWLRDRKLGQSQGLREDATAWGETDNDLEAWLASLPL